MPTAREEPDRDQAAPSPGTAKYVPDDCGVASRDQNINTRIVNEREHPDPVAGGSNAMIKCAGRRARNQGQAVDQEAPLLAAISMATPPKQEETRHGQSEPEAMTPGVEGSGVEKFMQAPGASHLLFAAENSMFPWKTVPKTKRTRHGFSERESCCVLRFNRVSSRNELATTTRLVPTSAAIAIQRLASPSARISTRTLVRMARMMFWRMRARVARLRRINQGRRRRSSAMSTISAVPAAHRWRCPQGDAHARGQAGHR